MTTASSMSMTARQQARRLGSRAKQHLVKVRERFIPSLEESNRGESGEPNQVVTEPPANPQLAVIVPAYNVSGYLEDCVNSVVNQSYSNWEMLIIDDGSTDGTGAIADRIATRDGRIRVVHQENQGLGAARNAGIRISQAPYMTFIDSDDLVAPDAFRLMMESGAESNSDVVIGSIDRFNSTRHWVPFWVDLVHDERRVGITAKELPAIMWDVFACNKIFKRSTWDDIVGEFPTGTLYEDQECTAKLFVNDVTLDILPEIVYHWRHREDGQSITQQKSNINDLAQRIRVAKHVESIVRKYTSSYVEYWYQKCLGEDLFYYYREVPRTETDFFETLKEGVKEFYDNAPVEAITNIDPARRWLAYLAAYGTREDMVNLLTAFDTYRTYYTAVLENGVFTAHVPGLEALFERLPRDLRLVKPDHLQAQALLSSVASDSDGSLTVEGYGYIPNLSFDLGFAVTLRDNEFYVSADTIEVVDEGPGAITADPYNPHSRARFRARFSSELLDATFEGIDRTETEELDLVVTLFANEHSWEVENPRRDPEGPGSWPVPSELTKCGHRFVVTGDPNTGTRLKLLTPRFAVKSLRITDGRLQIDAEQCTQNRLPNHDRFDLNNAYVRIKSGNQVIQSALVSGNQACFHVDLSLSGIAGHEKGKFSRSLYIDLICAEKFAAPLAVSSMLIRNLEPQGLAAVATSGFGYLEIERSSMKTIVESVSYAEQNAEIVVSGRHFVAQGSIRTYAPSLALVSKEETIRCSSINWRQDTGAFVARFPLLRETGIPYSDGRFVLQCLMPTKQDEPATLWVATSAEFEMQLPQDLATKSHNLRLVAVGRSRSLQIVLSGPGKTRDSESAYEVRTRSLRHFADPGRKVESRTVFFETFNGDAVTDSPKEIDRVLALNFPELKRYWSVRDLSVEVPPGAVPLVTGTDDWMRRLATSGVVINNNNFPHYFRKANGQKYIQTWHGTPLKKIGNDVPGANLSLRYRTLMTKEAEREWDLLLAQSPWAAETLSEAFAFEGPIFDSGYPRNDSLADPARLTEMRNRVRTEFGFGPNQTVVLYAPTWRDYLKDASGRYSRVDYLNMARTMKALGSSYDLLYRGHANSAHSQKNPLPSGVVDVTMHSDVNELMAAADLLITDYSSIMFDFVVSGKPIAFVAPDFERYRDETRGFYFNFEQQRPGPLFKSGSEAVQWIRSVAGGARDETEEYVDFISRFAPNDDGKSAERFVEQNKEIFLA